MSGLQWRWGKVLFCFTRVALSFVYFLHFRWLKCALLIRIGPKLVFFFFGVDSMEYIDDRLSSTSSSSFFRLSDFPRLSTLFPYWKKRCSSIWIILTLFHHPPPPPSHKKSSHPIGCDDAFTVYSVYSCLAVSADKLPSISIDERERDV